MERQALAWVALQEMSQDAAEKDMRIEQIIRQGKYATNPAIGNTRLFPGFRTPRSRTQNRPT